MRKLLTASAVLALFANSAFAEECGDVTFLGTCDGNVMIWCQDGELKESDCSTQGGTGGEYGSGWLFDCVFYPDDFTPCGDAPLEGTCGDENQLIYCDVPNDEESYGAYFFSLGYGLGMTAIQCSDACEMVPYEEESKGDSYAICKCDTATYTDYCDEFGMLHMCDGGAEFTVDCVAYGYGDCGQVDGKATCVEGDDDTDDDTDTDTDTDTDSDVDASRPDASTEVDGGAADSSVNDASQGTDDGAIPDGDVNDASSDASNSDASQGNQDSSLPDQDAAAASDASSSDASTAKDDAGNGGNGGNAGNGGSDDGNKPGADAGADADDDDGGDDGCSATPNSKTSFLGLLPLFGALLLRRKEK